MIEWLKSLLNQAKHSIRKSFLLVVSLLFLSQVSFTQTDSISNSIEFINQTFLGNNQRCYYGDDAPDSLKLIWKHYLGKGETVISRKLGSRIWAGAGWTGQPLLIKENNQLYLIQGAYDHNLKKINATDGKIVWQYAYDDVIKGAATIWKANDTVPFENRYVIFQGSRLGVGNYLDSKHIPSYRAISYITGKELWRLDVKWTKSYSRDVDGSALVLDDTIYIGLENSYFTLMDPYYQRAKIKDGMLQPNIYQETILYTDKDVASHGGNLVTESSPSLLNGVIYIASGTGHIWGYSLKEKKLVWEFFIGSDIDGSAIVTSDSCIIVTAEKQYIEGHGGMFKLDPSKPAEESVVWFLPTEDKEYAGWEGGIIGSAAINDMYRKDDDPYIAVTLAIDGYMYVVEHKSIDTTKFVDGPNLKYKYHPPIILSKTKVGASISTPLIDSNKIVSAGYGGLNLFSYDKNGIKKRIAHYPGQFESTPVFHNERLYIPSRNGYLYCYGEE